MPMVAYCIARYKPNHAFEYKRCVMYLICVVKRVVHESSDE